MGKADSTGTYSYVCDGTTPGSPILSDGQAVYTSGLSERRNGASLFYNNDDLGNLWTADDGTGKAEAGAYLFTGFGVSLYAGAGAVSASPLKYGGANDCQTDVDTGLVLMGHRYYDTRIGRFTNQDPIGDGDNWYAYAGNSPTNNVDPTGLSVYVDPFLVGTPGDPSQFDTSGNMSNGTDGTWDEYQSNGHGGWTYLNTIVHGGIWDQMNNPMSGGAPGVGMFANNPNKAAGSEWFRSKSDLEHGKHIHQGSKSGPRYNRLGQEVDGADRVKAGGGSIAKRKLADFQRVFDRLLPPREGDADAVAENALVGGEEGLELMGPLGMVVGAGIGIWDWYHNRNSMYIPILDAGPGYHQ